MSIGRCVCGSTNCKRYDICKLAICEEENKQYYVTNWHDYGSVNYTDDGVEEKWCCGERGNYAMFKPLDNLTVEDAVMRDSSTNEYTFNARNLNKEELISEHTYELDLGSDEEIKSFLKENGMPDISPDVIRDYIKSSMYKTFCETMYSKEQLDKLVDATNFARYVNSAINYNGRLPTDEEYGKLKEEYEQIKPK